MLLPPCGQLLRPPAVRIRWLPPSILCSLPAEESNRVSRTFIVYKDSWFDLLAINHLSNSLQAATGLRINKSGYDGLVETVITTSRLFSPAEQRRLVLQSLDMAFPGIILLLIKNLVPPSKFTRQFFALFTTIFFRWLVGPCEVRESELGGIIQRNVVHITKCRVLEETNCVGVCTNMCKMPSQAFIKNSLGMPVNMIPNFVDMSCEMIFGQEPPPESSDPAFSQPCYKICKVRPKAHEDKQLHRAEKVIRPDQG